MTGADRIPKRKRNADAALEPAPNQTIPPRILFAFLALAVVSGCSGGTSDINAGLAAEQRNSHEEAIRLYTRALLNGHLSRENEAYALLDRGIAYRKKGFLDKAIDDFDATIRLKPDFADAYDERGIAHDQKGDFDNAIADYDTAIRLKPDFAGAYNNRGYAEQEIGQYEKAIADYDVSLRLQPENFRAYTNRGTSYVRLGKYDKAIADYTAVIGLKPQNLDEAYFSRGLAYKLTGRYDEAVADFSEAIRLSPPFANAFAHRALAYQLKGQYARAVADYDEAARLNGGDFNIYGNRGLSRFALGQFTEAAADLEKSVRANPSNSYWPLWLHLARSRTGVSDADELTRNVAKIDRSKWPGAVVELYLGQATPAQVREAAAQGDARAQRNQRCEAAFYLGEYERQRQDLPAAASLLRQATEICPADFAQYSGIMAELGRLPRGAEAAVQEKPTVELPAEGASVSAIPEQRAQAKPISLLPPSTSVGPSATQVPPSSARPTTGQPASSAPATSETAGQAPMQPAPPLQSMAGGAPPSATAASSAEKPAAREPEYSPQVASLPDSQSWHVQLGAVRSSEEAEREWDHLRAKAPDVLGALTLRIERVDLGGKKGVYYRIQAGPIADQSSAASACKRLKAAQIDCLPVRG